MQTYCHTCRLQAPCGLEDSPCQTEADCCEGNPAVDQPPLYCVRATPLGRGTCKQVGSPPGGRRGRLARKTNSTCVQS